MSSFATLFYLERKFGVRAFLTAEQFELFASIFDLQNHWLRGRILGMKFIPRPLEFCWENPFE